jgi:uncharacterized protein (DUF2147 family)
MNSFKITLVIVASLFAFNLSAQSDIIGKWKTIDDETGKPKSIVEIFIKGGKAYGKIVKLFRESHEEQDPTCDECSDYRKDKKILGMTIITGMEQDDDEWEDGEILDPKNGKIYDCKLWIEDGKLKVRGYIAFFYRTQTWIKID